MAVGIQYYGKGTRGVPQGGFAPTETVTEEEEIVIPTTINLGGGAIDESGSGGGSGLSGQAAIMNAKLAQQKYADTLKSAEDASGRLGRGAGYQQTYLQQQLDALSKGGFNPIIAGELEAQKTAGEKYIQDQYNSLLGLLNTRKQTGETLTGQGYDALRSYLTANPATAYASAQRAAPTVTQNALAQYMQAQGVNPAMAQPAVDQANLAALGGATNYNQLLNVLAGSESAGQQSRLSEEQMARTLANAQLQSLYGGATQNLEQSRLSGLAELQNQITKARLQAEQDRITREQALQDAIATNLGTGYTCPPGFQKDAEGNCVPIPKPSTDGGGGGDGGGGQGGGGVKKSPSVAALAAIPIKASNTALQKRIADFVAAKPRATPAAVAKEFPQLAANLAKKKK
jgi:hypothetical protein